MDTQPPPSPIAAARLALQADDLPEAHRLLQQAMLDQPGNVEVLLLLAWTAPDASAAEGYFCKVLEIHPGHPLALDGLSGKGPEAHITPEWLVRLLGGLEPEPPKPTTAQGGENQPAPPADEEDLPDGDQLLEAEPKTMPEWLRQALQAIEPEPLSQAAEAGEETAGDLPAEIEAAGFGTPAEATASMPAVRSSPGEDALEKQPGVPAPELRSASRVIPPVTQPAAIQVATPDVQRASFRGRFKREHLMALVYLVGVTLAETLTLTRQPQWGMALHAGVMIAMLLQATLTERGPRQGFYISLTLAPLIRLMSLSLPLPSYPFIFWYAIVGAPLLLASFIAARIIGLEARMLGLTVRQPLKQGVIASTGILLGYMEYLILRPQPLAAALTFKDIWLPAMILMIFTGLLEEVLFRGLMQYTALRNLGRFGLVYVALVFAVLHLGYRSALDVLFVFGVAIFFGWLVIRTGSIMGVTLAHGLTNIALFLVFPFLLGAAPTRQSAIPATQQTWSSEGTGLHWVILTECQETWVERTQDYLGALRLTGLGKHTGECLEMSRNAVAQDTSADPPHSPRLPARGGSGENKKGRARTSTALAFPLAWFTSTPQPLD